MSRAAMRRGLLILAALCLVAGFALSARLLMSEGVFGAPGESRDVVASARDDRPADRSRDPRSPDQQQPAGLEQAEDWPAKKFSSDLAAFFAPFEIRDEGGGWYLQPAVVEAGANESPPQLLQRPPPAR